MKIVLDVKIPKAAPTLLQVDCHDTFSLKITQSDFFLNKLRSTVNKKNNNGESFNFFCIPLGL